MIDYETYCRVRLFHQERGLTSSQIGRELGIDPETAAKYAALDTYPRRRATKRASKLDAFKPAIIRWLEHHPYSATQIHQRLCAEEGYTGGFSIVKQYVRSVKPTRRPAFLKNLLAGLVLPNSLSAINTAGRHWLDTIANLRTHKETRQPPARLFAVAEKSALRPLPPMPADISVARTVRVTNRCRVVLDTNRYFVPHLYASQQLTLHALPDRLCLYHAHQLVATHPRCYERHRDFEDPDHVKELLDQRRRARDAKWLLTFYALSPHAEFYHQQLKARHLNERIHINKIVALTEIHGAEKVALAIEDAIQSQAYSSQYIENILEQRARHTPTPGPLHLTRRADLLDLELPTADLTPYDTI